MRENSGLQNDRDDERTWRGLIGKSSNLRAAIPGGRRAAQNALQQCGGGGKYDKRVPKGDCFGDFQA